MLGSRQFAIFLFVFMNKFSELHMHDFVQVKHCVHTKYLKVCTYFEVNKFLECVLLCK